jgi:Bromodomain
MDLMRIKAKLMSAQYNAVSCVVDDVNLIVENSITYNGPDNGLWLK